MLYIEEEEFEDLECPHCRRVMESDEDFINHECEPDDLDELLDGIPLLEDMH